MENRVRIHALEYRRRMLEDNRVILIEDENKPILIMFFSICNDPMPYARKETFDYLPHYSNGSIAFIERMEAKTWNKEIRKSVEQFLTSNFPNVEFGVWYRTKFNRTYKNNQVKVRRLAHV